MSGFLRVHVHTACRLFPLKNAGVRIFRKEGDNLVPVRFVLTDENGYTSETELDLNRLSVGKERNAECFAVSAEADGFIPSEKSEVIVYDNAVTVHSVELGLKGNA